jgi:hypothetical protein
LRSAALVGSDHLAVDYGVIDFERERDLIAECQALCLAAMKAEHICGCRVVMGGWARRSQAVGFLDFFTFLEYDPWVAPQY